MDEHPPGFRFYPTEEELISFYLRKKLEGDREAELFHRLVPVIDLYQFDPWHLPQISGELCHGDPEQWFFFCPRQEREARGGRPNRITSSGYWKATGSPGLVYSKDDRAIGVKKTMVFHQGRAPTGRKTKWKMMEYKAIEGEATCSNNPSISTRNEFSVCRVYITSGCLRAFDRRPAGPTTTDVSMDQAQTNVASTSHQQRSFEITQTLINNQAQGNVASSSHQGSPNTSDNSRSPDSASLGTEVHLSQTPYHADDSHMADPLWQWDELWECNGLK
ncbi:hypothetical protein AQUCO_07200079v1 [Aquilegia coerulea]|uniref:NAC domain-containing protein n=1 Tax=Aquilegia coerulea TaxID=218851 RepID=A0A2G5CA77_AQUCA|nr:hypothetical protein AQUCO_07200079v1 [Aquilegia coerulea]